jgi:voltage-gated potassium channel
MLFSIDLRFLRLLRLLRLLKLTHYFHGLDMFLDVLRSELKTIASAILTVLMLIVMVACLMFLFEHNAQPEAFGNILQSIWWSVVTLTTVGYGDITPVTMGGRILAIFIMLLGVGLVALPAGILAAKFSDELRARRDKLATQIHHALADGTIDHQERQDLDALTEELRISQSRLDDMIAMQKQHRGGPVVCPNCGTKIDESGSR